jgi:class 3 adenylate cyclase
VNYAACCGLSGGCPDHAARIVEFALDLLGIVRRMPRDRRPPRLQIGLDSGPAAGGVVGRTRIGYCLSGETVSIAAILCAQCPPDSILAAREVYQAASGRFRFGPAEAITAPGRILPAWPLKAGEARSAATAGLADAREVSIG